MIELPTRISHYPRRDGKLPEGAKYVGRPSRWGNPHKVVKRKGVERLTFPYVETAERAVELYAKHMGEEFHGTSGPIWREELRLLARDNTALACACPLDQPCHIDIIIRLMEVHEHLWPI